MKFICIVTHNFDATTTTTKTIIDAINPKQAHDAASCLYPDADLIRAYPATDTALGLARGALMIARRTAINATTHGGTETQQRIEREFAAVNARCISATSAERIYSVIKDYSADTQDMHSEAVAALHTASGQGLPIDQQYKAAYKALNAMLHAQKAATVKELSTQYVQDMGGDLVAISRVIVCILRGGDSYTPCATAEMDANTRRRFYFALTDAAKTLNPTQADILKRLALGQSQRQTADATGKRPETVCRNVAIMRAKMSAYLQATEFADLIKARQAMQAGKQAANNGGKKDAAYYRAYRARKKAEKAD